MELSTVGDEKRMIRVGIELFGDVNVRARSIDALGVTV